MRVDQLPVLRPFAAFRRTSSDRWSALPRNARRLVMLLALLFAVFAPESLERQWQSVLFYPVGVFILLALGLNIVVGHAGLLDLGYVAFYAVGAYTTALLTTSADWNISLALPFAIGAAMAAGVLLGAPTLRLRGDYLAIVTLGFGEIVRIVASNTNALGETRGIVGIPHPSSLGPLEFGLDPLPYYWLTLVAVLLAIGATRRLRASRVGRSWAALREDEDAAEVMGVPTFTMKLWAFAMGASTGGLGGWIYASKVSYINPENFPFFLSVIILAAVVLGGMGSTPGVIVGAFALAFLPEYLRDAAAGESVASALHAVIGGDQANVTEYRVLLFGAAIVIMMLLRPEGIIPNRRRQAELAHAGAVSGLGAVAPTDEDDENAVPVGDVGVAVRSLPTGFGPYLAGGASSMTATAAMATVGSSAARASALEEIGGSSSPAATGVRSEREVVLRVEHLDVRFGGVHALQDVSFGVGRGEIFGIIGPNGAGKTTLFNCITGVVQSGSGEVTCEGSSLRGRKPHEVTTLGVARTFQNIRLFPSMTVLENVMVGADAHHATSVPGALLTGPRHRREERHGRALAEQLVEFVDVASRRDDAAGSLAYGDQRRLEIARALATQPSVVLLDEPAAGMNPSEKSGLLTLIRAIRDQGFTVVLIEHDMGLVMEVCDRIAVLDFGQKIAEGTPAEVRANPRVIEAYLGVSSDAS